MQAWVVQEKTVKITNFWPFFVPQPTDYPYRTSLLNMSKKSDEIDTFKEKQSTSGLLTFCHGADDQT